MSDQIALITGASRGIGKAILHQLGRQGIKVIGTATTPEGAEKIHAGLRQASMTGMGLVLDVTQDDSIKALVEEVKSNYSPPSILVNNAGITKDNLLMRMKEDEWQDVINTNLSSIYRISKSCLRDMMKARYGRIINITSVVALSGNAGQANYSAAKAGMIGFTKSLAQEVATRGITVNAIAPGFIDTDMTGELSEDQQSALLSQIPMGRMGSPQDIANAVSFLISEGAAYITGETININGGLYMA
ncbi:MAG: 3-oxoacyl-ACP reductase FabG [Gammaproteobacteria bacterium]